MSLVTIVSCYHEITCVMLFFYGDNIRKHMIPVPILTHWCLESALLYAKKFLAESQPETPGQPMVSFKGVFWRFSNMTELKIIYDW